ncbi:colicin-like pore-forming protein [Serratia marcescens]|uniref:colicin-like pore-forming protein n=1 Tax=Serratia marcescens TaxID=615 RepID=UPI001D01C763|nr:colicin-like pore-forming protein [Serratia marcescens]
MARYEDTTQYERDVMTSLGYHWRGEGWQRGFDLSDGDMVVEAWVGDRLPERQKELSNITHLWDQKISDINKPISAFDQEDDDIIPFSEKAKNSFRADFDKAIKFSADKENDLKNQISEMQKDIDDLSSKLKNKSQTLLEKASLEAIIAKIKVGKERLDVLRNEAKKRKVHQEYLKLNNENWFLSREKPTSGVKQQQNSNRIKMGMQLDEEKKIQSAIDANMRNTQQYENDLRNKESEVNRLKSLDLSTEEGINRAENEARKNEQSAQHALNDAKDRINQANGEKARAENVGREHERKAAQAEEKRKKHSQLLDDFVRWNSEVDYGKKAWWKEFNAASDLISNLEKERDDALSVMNASRESASRAANRQQQATRDQANAESALNSARKTLADVQAKKAMIAKEKKEAETKAEEERVKDAIKFTADFYKTVTEKFGEHSSKVAKELAEAAKGKSIKNVDDALKAFEKHNNVLNKKFGVKDREAIAKAMESVNRDQMAKSLAKFSKAFNYIGKTIDRYDTVVAIGKAIETNNWRPVFIQIEALAAGRAATALTAFSFSIILGTPMGFLGFAIITTLVGAFIDEALVEKINKELGI